MALVRRGRRTPIYLDNEGPVSVSRDADCPSWCIFAGCRSGTIVEMPLWLCAHDISTRNAGAQPASGSCMRIIC